MTGTIGKVVIARQRFARVWGLGDRKSPVAMTPALVALEGDEIPIELSPFTSSLLPRFQQVLVCALIFH